MVCAIRQLSAVGYAAFRGSIDGTRVHEALSSLPRPPALAYGKACQRALIASALRRAGAANGDRDRGPGGRPVRVIGSWLGCRARDDRRERGLAAPLHALRVGAIQRQAGEEPSGPGGAPAGGVDTPAP